MIVEYTARREISEEDLCDIWITAVEGGVNYWAQLFAIHHDRKGEEYEACFEDDEGARRTINRATIVTGLEKLARLDAHWARHALLALLEGGYDANDADILVQIALFDRLVYS